jgi:hypothetical protein
VSLDTKLEHQAAISGDDSIGVKDHMMVVQRKTQMNEELRRLQYEVYELEDHVYGNRKYGSLGLYGVLKACRTDVADQANGGDGHVHWNEPMDRITDKEPELKMGLDEKGQIVGVNEEYLHDRTERFLGYKQVLMKRQDGFQDDLAICQAQLKSQKYDLSLKAQNPQAATPE